ncbi:MAG: hypothetical protein ACO1QS_12500 [Verrucomicrobiota bacterium]
MEINRKAIALRGGLDYSDADFSVVQCTHCNAQFLYDEEILTIYFDPQELSKNLLIAQPCSPCPSCGDADWDFIKCDSEKVVRDGRWSWVLI